MLKEVATSTVVAAVPIDPPVIRLAIAIELFRVEPLLVRLELTVSPELAVTSPLKVGLLTTETVRLPPNETIDPPVILVPLVRVIDEFCKPLLARVVPPAAVSCPSPLTVKIGTDELEP